MKRTVPKTKDYPCGILKSPPSHVELVGTVHRLSRLIVASIRAVKIFRVISYENFQSGLLREHLF